MDQLLAKIENIIDKLINDLQNEPIKTSVKLLILYWVIKTIWKDLRRN